MIKSYISEIEMRMKALKTLLGENPEKNESQIKSINEKLKQFCSKLHKDIKIKYEKVRKFSENHHPVADSMLTSDKINIVLEELDELKETADSLDKVQRLLPVLNEDTYMKLRDEYDNLHFLSTCSDISLKNGRVSVQKYDPTPLVQLREGHRKQMNAIVELNHRMVHNLNEKLKAAQKRRAEK